MIIQFLVLKITRSLRGIIVNLDCIRCACEHRLQRKQAILVDNHFLPFKLFFDPSQRIKIVLSKNPIVLHGVLSTTYL